MDATVVVAAMGFVSTLLGAWLAAYWQRRSYRNVLILDAKMRAYGECAAALYEYERASYNRVKARLEQPEAQRDELRQEAYRCNALARSAIGQATILSATDSLREELESVRKAIGDLNQAADHRDLKQRHDAVNEALNQVLGSAVGPQKASHPMTRHFGHVPGEPVAKPCKPRAGATRWARKPPSVQSMPTRRR
jgi:hypothetical protein